MTTATQITKFLNDELNINDFEDTSCNGLQMENEGEILKVGFAVDACRESYEKAVAQGCQMLIVHHGMIWDGIKYIKGNVYQNVKYLVNNNLALYAAHLPLDAHEKYGNNIKIAKCLNLQEIKPFGYHKGKPIGFMGEFMEAKSLTEVQDILVANGMRKDTLPFGKELIKKVCIVSGGAANDIFQAVNVEADLFITGESAHHVHHVAKENKMHFIYAGHYETEVFGVQALMELVKEQFGVEVEFLDVPTLV